MRRGTKTIISGFVLLIAAMVATPLVVVLLLIPNKSSDFQFKVPGKVETTIEKPGRYYLWDDFQTLYEGKSYNRSENLPDGIEIRIQDASGHQLQLSADTSISAHINSIAKKSIGYVEITHPETIQIQISGGNEDRIFSFSQLGLRKILYSVIGGMGLSVLLAMMGVIAVIWGIIKLARRSR